MSSHWTKGQREYVRANHQNYSPVQIAETLGKPVHNVRCMISMIYKPRRRTAAPVKRVRDELVGMDEPAMPKQLKPHPPCQFQDDPRLK